VRGPLQVFGPPGDDASVDRAKMRTTPAFFRGADGNSYVFVAGSTKAKRCTPEVVPPSVARLRVVTEAGKPAHLAREAVDTEIAFVNPGSPVVTSDAGRGPVVWVVDQNARRTLPLLDPATPAPVLYAVDGTTMKLLWKTQPSDLEPGGKYVTPAIAHGTVFVATDRLHAFGLAR
jgi:outer membrane protein assembly factor BamB